MDYENNALRKIERLSMASLLFILV